MNPAVWGQRHSTPQRPGLWAREAPEGGEGAAAFTLGHAEPGGPGKLMQQPQRRPKEPRTAPAGTLPVGTQGTARAPELSDGTGMCGLKTRFAGGSCPELERRSRGRLAAGCGADDRPGSPVTAALSGDRSFISKPFRFRHCVRARKLRPAPVPGQPRAPEPGRRSCDSGLIWPRAVAPPRTNAHSRNGFLEEAFTLVLRRVKSLHIKVRFFNTQEQTCSLEKKRI